MKVTQTIFNETLGKRIDVTVDRGGFAYHAEVRTNAEVEMGREGFPLTVPQLNKLFAYYHAAGHVLKESVSTVLPPICSAHSERT